MQSLVLPAGKVVEYAQRIDVADADASVSITAEERSGATVAVQIGDAVERLALKVEAGVEAYLTVVLIHRGTASLSVTATGDAHAGAVLQWQCMLLGSGVTDLSLVSHVIGKDAQSAIDCCFFGMGKDRISCTVRNVFDAPNGSGEILMRGIAQDQAHGSFKGMIEIGLKGNGTNTYLTQEVLMLDATAKVDAVPGLEIKTNDVKASHSATVVRVTPEDLFYFGSRGITPHEARRMFVRGFLGSIINRVTDATLRASLFEALDARMGEG